MTEKNKIFSYCNNQKCTEKYKYQIIKRISHWIWFEFMCYVLRSLMRWKLLFPHYGVPSVLVLTRTIRTFCYKTRAGRKRRSGEKIFKNTFDWCFRVCIIEKLFLWSVHKVILDSEINEFISTPFRLWTFKIGEMDWTQGHNGLQSSQSASIQSGGE